MTLQQRLDCPHSYADDNNKNLLCDVGDTICDGKLYECCLWDRNYKEQLEIMMEVVERKKE